MGAGYKSPKLHESVLIWIWIDPPQVNRSRPIEAMLEIKWKQFESVVSEKRPWREKYNPVRLLIILG